MTRKDSLSSMKLFTTSYSITMFMGKIHGFGHTTSYKLRFEYFLDIKMSIKGCLPGGI
jgi:hypothetical protein